MTITAAQVDVLLMGCLGQGPAGRTTLLGVIVDARVPLGAAELVLQNWIRDGILRRQIEPCPGVTDCYRLHTKVNMAKRPTQTDTTEDVDELDPKTPLDKIIDEYVGARAEVNAAVETALQRVKDMNDEAGRLILGDESKPPTTAAEWRARAMAKQRIKP